MNYYAEYHEHVRAIHLTINLPSAPDNLTSLEAYDRKTLRLRHAFRSYSIALPASINPDETLIIPSENQNVSVRLKASPIIKGQGTLDVPFSTPEELGHELLCHSCHSRLVSGSLLSWRQLPSEHWVEMMDSWHCHRGVTDDHYNQHHDQYALPDHIISATERIRARPGIGLIGLSYLLVDPDNLEKYKVSLAMKRTMRKRQRSERRRTCLDSKERSWSCLSLLMLIQES